MLRLISDLCSLLFIGPLLLLGGLFKLLDLITGAVPGTPSQDRGAKLFVVLSILGLIAWFLYMYLLTDGAIAPK